MDIPRFLILMVVPCLLAAQTSIKNFAQVDEHVYRGAQPTREGFQELVKMGIKTVVNLRPASERPQEQSIVESLGMKYVNIPMTMHAPTDEQMSKALAELNTSANWPVFLHCEGGRDRTGTVIACYRIAHDRWDKHKALAEARVHGMSPFDIGMERYIRRFHGQPGNAAPATN